MTRRIALVSVLMVALFALSFSAVQAAHRGPDSVITANVETALSAALPQDVTGTNSSRIDVKTVDGVVSLSGDVMDESSKVKAGQAAERVQDVKSVVNGINVRSGR